MVIVPGEGPENARVMLIGQNPGREEVKLGRPFVGRSGKFLDFVLKDLGIPRTGLYITAAVKIPTARNRKPTKQEIEDWRPALLDEIKRVKPEIIVLMGEVAWKTPRLPGIRYIETYHPAAAMRFPKVRQRFLADFKQLADSLTRPLDL
ncbi:MAG: uracil-DNA glycosylase [Dehalococcoidales bacterium]|nr:uracil-DNA glycosylase [Dehalococcoidales bacterium]